MDEFHVSLRAVTIEPLELARVLQAWVKVWPPGNVNDTVQPFTRVSPACTITSPWNPVFQLPVVLYIAMQPVPVGGGFVGGGLVAGVGGGVAGGVGGGGVVPPPPTPVTSPWPPSKTTSEQP